MPEQYGIIGYPLTHSFSPAYFTRKFAAEHIDATYTAFPLEDIAAFPTLLEQHPDLKGLNVTIPYKEKIIPYLDELSDAAAAIGAVNCIKITNGRTIGYNTDITGFTQSLVPVLGNNQVHALVLGTGGASKAVTAALEKLGIPYQNVSRSAGTGVLTYQDLTPELMQQYRLIVNTTPLGMNPDILSFPSLPYDALEPEHILYDLIYNPERTSFLSIGRQYGATIKNGQEMLELQAEAGWKIWQDAADAQ